jgi:hypothetical protein
MRTEVKRMKRKKMNKKLKNFLVNLCIFLVAAAIFGVVMLIRNSYTIYDFTHLTRFVNHPPSDHFTPVPGVAKPAELADGEWEPAADNAVLTLYVSLTGANIAVHDKRNGHIWYSCPPGFEEDQRANAYEKEIMQSMVGFRYFNELKRRNTKWVYAQSVANEQFEWQTIPGGARIVYQIGDLSLGIDAVPRFLTNERYEERVLAHIDEEDARFLRRIFIASRDREGFMEMPLGARTHHVNSTRTIEIFEKIGYTLDELDEDNEIAGIEMVIDRDTFQVELEFTLHNDTMAVNFPVNRFMSSEEGNNLFYVDILRYFGAGGLEDEGYMFVPSGSGALIEFNNGKTNEDPYLSSIYGLDPLMNQWLVQDITPARLPVMGIKKDNAAVLKYVENGSAMAVANADVSGRNNSFNTAWFNFMVRDSQNLSVEVVIETDSLLIQEYAYEGDITVHYAFLANEAADYTGMALAYQQSLINKGMLTRLAPQANAPFYLDIVGAVEKREFVLGTPYVTFVPMTTYAQANAILDELNASGVNAVQMQWFGWFNRGLNHVVAKNIKPIRSIGSLNEMNALNQRLQADGGALYPAVNFNLVNGMYVGPFNSVRGITLNYEAARDIAGFLGNMSDFKREFLNYMGGGGGGLNNWYCIITPGVLPMHVGEFIPTYQRKIGLDSLSLTDLGDVLTSSLFRRNSVDREHSRLITAEQMDIFNANFGNIMVSGGNDYALGIAKHVVNAPVEKDKFYMVDHEVPFYQTVLHGFINYTGLPFNTREMQDVHMSFLNSMATGAALHFQWSYAPTQTIEFTPYEKLYSTQYRTWLDEAAHYYRQFNEVHGELRHQRIIGHEILAETRHEVTTVTVTEYENGTRIYVNTTDRPFDAGGVAVPPRGYTVTKGGR